MINSWKRILEKRRQDWAAIKLDRDSGMSMKQLERKYHRTRQGIYWILKQL